MTEHLSMDTIVLVDADGDRMRVGDDGGAVRIAGYPLLHGEVENLRNYLNEWLDDSGRAAADLARPTCCTGEDSSECCPTPDNVVPLRAEDPRTILEEAQDAVYGDRQGDYGHPREDFTRTAIIWTGLLQHKLAEGAFIDAEDVPRCMIGVKLSRDVHTPKRDNRVDGAGYFLTLDRLDTGR